MSSSSRRAVILVSGGLDSATVLAVARGEGREMHALSFDYGQRHRGELQAARRMSESSGVTSHRTVSIDLRQFGGSALTDEIDVPKDHLLETGIPLTYVPARNTIFLALAVAHAEVLDAEEIWIGINAVDTSGYPDCRPEFVEAFQKVIALGTRSGVERGRPEIVAPLLHLSKGEIIRWGMALGADYSSSRSCYDPDGTGLACGHCDACILRKRGFEEAGVADPTLYSMGVNDG